MTLFRYSSLLFLLIWCAAPVSGQKVLQIEVRGSIEAKKFYVGDELYVKLEIDKFWRNSVILDIDVANKVVDFNFGPVTLDEIVKIKTPQQKFRGKSWRNRMLITGASFAVYTPLELLYQDEPNYGFIAGGVGIGVLGFIVQPIINLISVERIGGRKRLRLLDIGLE